MKLAASAGAMVMAVSAYAAEPKETKESMLDMVKPHAITTETYLESAVDFAKSAYTAADMPRPQKDLVQTNIRELRNAVDQADAHAMHVSEMMPAEKKPDVADDLKEFRAELTRVKDALKPEITDPRQARMTLAQVWPHLTAARDRFGEVSEDIGARIEEPPAMERGATPTK